ncbi:MAG: NAD-dependent epimerase/dehydratase family protein [Eubacteriales bacterium]|nr:NAD-dependent epimerase/dehydratase family protein [Eubacteriales bacterium]
MNSSKNVKYLVTGAAGNLGYNVVHELLSQGKIIRAFVLPGDKATKHLPPEVEICEGNVLNKKDLEKFFNVPANTEVIVIHCAGIVATVWNYVKAIYDVNVHGTQNVVNQCVKSNVKKLVYVSSVHAITELPKGQLITENKEFEPDRIVGFYGKTKAKASQIVSDAIKEHGLNATLVFPSGLCGPHDYAIGYVTQLLIDCAQNRLPAGIEGGYDFADVRDVAKGVVAAVEKGAKGEGYILGNRYVPVREILRQVHEITGARLVKHMFPIWAARLLLPFFEVYSKINKQPQLFTKYSIYTLLSNSSFSIEKAKRELGYTVRPFKETISDTLKWLREEGYIKVKKRFRPELS